VSTESRLKRSVFRRLLYHRTVILFLSVVAVALMSFDSAENYATRVVRQAVADVITPVLSVLYTPVEIVRGGVDRLNTFTSVYKDNEQLRAENARLWEWQAAALGLERRVQRFEALLNVGLEPDIQYVTGRVVGDASGIFVNSLIVNLGRDHDVLPGQGVVSVQGAVGRVISTGPGAARVLLLSDLNSQVPVFVGAGYSRAVLSGDNTSLPVLKYLGPNVHVRPGDRVVSSGHGGVFPPDVPVGVVVPAQEGAYRVRLFSDLHQLDFVRILNYMPSVQIDEGGLPPQLVDDVLPPVRPDENAGASLPVVSSFDGNAFLQHLDRP